MNTAAMTLERLAQFGHAWRGKDLDAVMQFMTDDSLSQRQAKRQPAS